MVDRQSEARHRPLWWHVALILLVAFGLRLLAWWILPYRGFISDEAEYLAASTWLSEGRGFSFFQGWIWTRPPLYVMFLATQLKLFGPETLWPIRLSQALLSTLSVWLTMRLGAALAPPERSRQVALTAGWAMALTYSFITFAFLLLSETLFITLLLAAFLALVLWAQRQQMRWLVLGAILLGLCALTRAVLAGALPLIALWVLVEQRKLEPRTQNLEPREQRTKNREQEENQTSSLPPRLRQRERGLGGEGLNRSSLFSLLFPVALLTLIVSGLILPWSFYNTRFYNASGLILIDTTGGYNAMLGAQAAHQELDPDPACAPTATRCEAGIYRTLKAIDDHAERQQLAYSTALAWITENPGGFLRKTGRELVDLLLVNYGGAERLYNGYRVGEVPAPHLLGLLLDDALYVLAMPLAMLGLARRQDRRGKGLILIWLLYNLATGPLFFAINRFRLPLLPFLLIYAACGIWQWRAIWPSTARRAVGLGLASILALVLIPTFVYWREDWGGHKATLVETIGGFEGLFDARRCAEIEALLDQGRLEQAQQLHDEENRRSPRTCLALLQSQIYAARGETQQALDLLQSMDEIPQRYLLEGEIYRSLGDLEAARNPFAARRLEPQNPTRWAWDHLNPPPTHRIDLGNGLDWGYVDGFFQREFLPDSKTPFEDGFRWTSPQARLKFVGAGTGQPQTLTLRVRRPVDPPAQLTVAGAEPTTFEIGAEWQEVSVALPATPSGEDVIVNLRSTVFVPGPDDLQARQQVGLQLRLLGVQVDWAELGVR
ncbi:MAG: glycosyltransferase family 39 protein [Chloroflexi bacterium]|nr:glycosyltransferase family 39 protein [Chloroflexota bacterium]